VCSCTNVTSGDLPRSDTILEALGSSLDRLFREPVPVPRTRIILTFLAVGAFLCAFAAYGQDSTSVADAARQARAQKQQRDAAEASKSTQPKDASGKDSPTNPSAANDASVTDKDKDKNKDAEPPKPPKKVITNDEIPEHIGPTRTLPPNPGTTYPQPNYYPANYPNQADYWKNQIQGQKNYIISMQAQIDALTESLHDSGGNCVTNCVLKNETLLQKQQRLEMMKEQLKQMQKQLEQVQEMARKQGYGSSVYDP